MQISKLWECEATDAQKLLSQWEKVAKCNFKSKAQAHEKCFFLMKWTVFCNAEDRFSWVWAFLQKKVILELKCTNSLLRASKNTNSVFSANKQIMRMRGHRCSKIFLSEKKLLNAILRAKLKHIKNVLMKWTVFAMQKTDFHVFELFAEKVF